MAREAGTAMPLLESVITTNDHQIEYIFKRILELLGDTPNPVVGLWGLTFKAGTDDRRRSSAVRVAKKLVDSGISVRGYDPTVSIGNDDDLRGIEIVGNPYVAAEGASLVVLLTEWPEFVNLDWGMVSNSMKFPTIFDTRNLLAGSDMRRMPIHYWGLGISRRDSSSN
jgi:UDPglucose 6-dehydrogenase